MLQHSYKHTREGGREKGHVEREGEVAGKSVRENLQSRYIFTFSLWSQKVIYVYPH